MTAAETKQQNEASSASLTTASNDTAGSHKKQSKKKKKHISKHVLKAKNDAKEKEGYFPPLLASMFSILMQASEGGKTANKGR